MNEQKRKTIEEMSVLELEDEYENTMPTFVRLAKKELRYLEVSTTLLRKYKEEIDYLNNPKADCKCACHKEGIVNDCHYLNDNICEICGKKEHKKCNNKHCS